MGLQRTGTGQGPNWASSARVVSRNWVLQWKPSILDGHTRSQVFGQLRSAIKSWLFIQVSFKKITKINRVSSEYLASGSTCQVNIDNKTLDIAIKTMKDSARPLRWCFNVVELMILFFTCFYHSARIRNIHTDESRLVLTICSFGNIQKCSTSRTTARLEA